ncbi:MAG: CC_3452 family protein [Sphingopyxis sp.]
MNTLRLSALHHVASFAFAILIAAGLFVSAAASAQPRSTAFYNATLSTAATAPRTIAGEIVWNCDGTSYTAGRGTSRPAIVCARMVRSLGPVTSFTANGRALDAAELTRCNAAAG